jgi:hypothetical protein
MGVERKHCTLHTHIRDGLHTFWAGWINAKQKEGKQVHTTREKSGRRVVVSLTAHIIGLLPQLLTLFLPPLIHRMADRGGGGRGETGQHRRPLGSAVKADGTTVIAGTCGYRSSTRTKG